MVDGAIDDFGVVRIPSPRDLVDDEAVPMLEVHSTGALTPSRRSCPYMRGFCNFRLPLEGGMINATSRLLSDCVEVIEVLSPCLEKVVELYVGIFDVDEAAVDWAGCVRVWVRTVWGTSISPYLVERLW